MKKRELILNIILVIMELIGILHSSIVLQRFALEYYTEDSNLFALIVTIIYLFFLFEKKKIPKMLSILRLASLIGLSVTFLVVLFVLVPMSNFNFGFMFGGANFFLHLACPLLLFYLYVFIDKKIKLNKKDIFMAIVPTLIYSAIIIALNIFKLIEGPYPFLMVYKQPVFMSIFWCVSIIGGAYLLALALNKIKNKL